MPIPGSGDDGNMIADLAHFDLTREIADSDQQKPWPSGIYAKTLYKKRDFRAVLISMETAARIKDFRALFAANNRMLVFNASRERKRPACSRPGNVSNAARTVRAPPVGIIARVGLMLGRLWSPFAKGCSWLPRRLSRGLPLRLLASEGRRILHQTAGWYTGGLR